MADAAANTLELEAGKDGGQATIEDEERLETR